MPDPIILGLQPFRTHGRWYGLFFCVRELAPGLGCKVSLISNLRRDIVLAPHRSLTLQITFKSLFKFIFVIT